MSYPSTALERHVDVAERMGIGGEDRGLTVIRRLHRLVRHGYRPWLGYDVASGEDQDIHLHRRDGVAVLQPDGSVVLPAASTPGASRTNGGGAGPGGTTTIAADDAMGFDALFPPNAKNRRNIMRRLYETGFLAR